MPRSHRDYTVGCICPMGVELAPVKAMLDHIHPSLPTQRDQTTYTLGDMNGHNLVIAILPEIGTSAAANVAVQLLNDFPSIRFGLLVGIGGGLPDENDDENDIRLGDVVISKPTSSFGGVVQYDLGKFSTGGGFERTGVLAKPPPLLRTSVELLAADHRLYGSRVPQYLKQMLEKYPAMEEDYSHPGADQDFLFQADYNHPGGPNCRKCDVHKLVIRDSRRSTNPKFHYGTIGSANMVVKDTKLRDELRRTMKIICVEMEGAGLMDSFPCLVIRGICDYSDSHKNKKWQPYAAATAAAYMKELLSVIPPKEVASVSTAADAVHTPEEDYDYGLNLFDGPELSTDLFIGRAIELREMDRVLQPTADARRRRILVLGGMGGIGKTQMAIYFAKQNQDSYSSIFWLNATNETTMANSLRLLANRVLPSSTVKDLKDDQLQILVLNWLSERRNNRWLLILDNHDEPDQYNIAKYYPAAAHGSIIVTTRQPRRINGDRILMKSMTRTEECLRILATRSGRDNVETDPAAHRLVARLDGHLLALASAGAFLSQSSISFSRYLEQYEAEWAIMESSEELSDYPQRTLYSTWDLSFAKIQMLDARAARLLRFLAYFDHQSIWHGLLSVAAGRPNIPSWFRELAENEFVFENALHTLTRYCLVEPNPQTGSYSLHRCVHDWTLAGLNRPADQVQFWLAANCIALHFYDASWSDFSKLKYSRLLPHAERLLIDRFQEVVRWNALSDDEYTIMECLAKFLEAQNNLPLTEQLYQRLLAGVEESKGANHPVTLAVVYNVAGLYWLRGNLSLAIDMYLRALNVQEKALGPDHRVTIGIVNNLGLTYMHQHKYELAEEMFLRALASCEKTMGKSHLFTVDAINNLGLVYNRQNKLEKSEEMHQRALVEYLAVVGPEHIRTFEAYDNLGEIYVKLGKLEEGEKLHLKSLAWKEKTLTSEHASTLGTVSQLAEMYHRWGKYELAEKMFVRAIAGYTKFVGPDHYYTKYLMTELGKLRSVAGNSIEHDMTHTRLALEDVAVSGTSGSTSRSRMLEGPGGTSF